jgi:hypothetical protein
MSPICRGYMVLQSYPQGNLLFFLYFLRQIMKNPYREDVQKQLPSTNGLVINQTLMTKTKKK